MQDVYRITIDRGASEWQIYQQDFTGKCDIALEGHCSTMEKGLFVELRLINEDNGVEAAPHLRWRKARMLPRQKWSATLADVPAGGLYRLDTRLRIQNKKGVRLWAPGEVVHFLGVGDLWVLAGQSNSSGTGKGPCVDGPELGVHAFNKLLKWTLASQPMGSGHSPWLHWAKVIKAAVGYPIGLIQSASGGSSLCMWSPFEQRNVDLYGAMVKAVAAAGGKVKGMLWYQGEADSFANRRDTYQKRFAAAVGAWRKAFKNPQMPILTVQLNRSTSETFAESDRSWSVVREAQRRASHSLRNVTVTPAWDLPQSDAIHNSSHGNRLLGERMAAVALGAVYKRNVQYLAPEPASAKRNRDGTIVEVSFDNVAGDMDSITPGMSPPFSVQDVGGHVSVVKVEYPGGAKVRVHLGRAIAGKAVIHGVYGKNPPLGIFDVPRMMPMLAFCDFPIE